MTAFLYYVLLNVLICSSYSLHPPLAANAKDGYKLVSLTYHLENANRRSGAYSCTGEQPKLKVVSNLKKAAQQISRALFDNALLEKVAMSNRIEHGAYLLSAQEVTYSKRGNFVENICFLSLIAEPFINFLKK